MSNESAIRREVGPMALMFTGLGSIIGSGWLFGAWRAAQLAGPGAVYSWIIGAVIILFVALTYAELGAMFPESGGAVRYSQYSHGSLVGFVAGWSGWIAIVSVIPVEAEASVQYMSSWKWQWTHDLYHHAANGQGVLTASGLAIAGVLVILYFLVNFWSVKVFAETNSAITFFKLIVPAATAVMLMVTSFHWSNFHIGIHGGVHTGNLASILTAVATTAKVFSYNRYQTKGNLAAILTAVATSGIVFSYNGFQNPVNLAGEARNPGRSVPFAIFGAIALSTVVYLLLQVAFLGSVGPESLKDGWASLEYSSPFAQLAVALNLNWLAILLYGDAFVSPSGTGTTYTASTARLIYAMERNGTVPSILGRVHPRYGIPRPAMWFNLLVSFIFLFSYKGWSLLAAVISVATIITYLIVPISVVVLRNTAPDMPRPLRVPGLKVLSPLAFTLATLMLFWARWPNTGKIMVLLVLPMPVYFYYQAKNQWRGFDRALRAAWWLIGYLLAITALSWAGSGEFGGRGYIAYGWDQLCVAVTSLFFYNWGVRSGWRTPDVEAVESRARAEGPLRAAP